jgi:hypothetical protein
VDKGLEFLNELKLQVADNFFTFLVIGDNYFIVHLSLISILFDK